MLKQLEPKIINWGIIGLGSIANKFATDLIAMADSKLYAVASRSQEKADVFGQKFNATRAYNSYTTLAIDPNIDAVYIATPHALHKENTLLCLSHGKAVLCEKPFAMNKNEVDEMIALAKKNNVLLMEALWTYFLPHYQYVLNILKNETYGNVINMEASFGFYRKFNNDSRLFKKELGGGALLDIGIYPIFAALSTLGIPINMEADATFFDNGADSSCDMIFRYNNNISATLKASLLEDLRCEAVFICEKAIIKINRMFHSPSTVSIIVNGKEEIIDFDYKTNGYRYEIDHVNKLLREGKTESDIMSFDFSRNLILTIDNVRTIIGLHYN